MQRQTFPLHPSQEDVYLDQSINTESPHYNIGGYIKIKGPLDIKRFRETVNSLPLVFDAYKMRFELNEIDPLCYFDAGFLTLDLPELDISADADPQTKAQSWMQDRFNTPFLLEKNRLLFEHCLIKISVDEYYFFCRYHHLVTDGYGFIVFVNYVAQKYRSLVSGNDVAFIYPSYLEQAIKGYEYKNSGGYQSEEKYWLEKIPAKPQKFLHKKYERQHDSGKKSSTYNIKLSEEERVLVEDLQHITKSGLQQLTIAALLTYFGKTSDQSEFIFGIPVHKRGSRQLRNTMGMFSGVLPHKAIFQKKLKLIDLLSEIGYSQKRDYRNQNYTIGDLSRALKLNASEGYLCDVMINYESLNFEADFDERTVATVIQLKSEYQRNPLQISWLDYGKLQPLELHIHFWKEYYSTEEISLFAQRIIFLFRQFSSGLTKIIGDFELVSLKEKLLLDSFNNTFIEFSKDKSIVDLFEEQVSKTPGNIAILFEQQQLSYGALNERSNQLAHYLINKGVKNEMLVPLCIKRSPEMIVAILGILKAGGAYVPIDPQYPEERISFMLEDTRAALVICSKETSPLLQNHPDLNIVTLDQEWMVAGNHALNNPVTVVKPNQLAYVIYTSGSTGKPKGVMIEHGGVVNLIKAQTDYFGINSDERILQFSNYCFDASVEQVFLALFNGASLILFKEGLQFNIDLFEKFLEDHRVSHLHATPLFLETLPKSRYHYLKRVIAGGDVCKKELANYWKNEAEFYNEYGPTETTVTAIEYKDDANNDVEKNNAVPIGTPLANVTVYILDMEGSFCPIGIAGEIYVSGVQVARGYLNLEDLTREKFLPDAFSKEPGAKMYKTGDTARWLPDGNIEYLGRTDEQVKIRGYRIELGEIECALLQSDLIKQAVVLAKKDKEGNNQLVGYIVPGEPFKNEVVKEFLRGKLPAYMIPDIWVVLEELPLNANGKIDKHALPDPGPNQLTNKIYVAPGNNIEAELISIWEELFDLDKISVHDNFFGLGGHSLKAVQLVSRLQERFHIKTDIKKIFSNPTIRELGKIIPLEDQKKSIELIPLPEQDSYELSHAQKRIWVLSHFKEGSMAYSIPRAYILEGILHVANLQRAFNMVIERHEILRTVFIEVNGEPRQKILPSSMMALTFEETDLRGKNDVEGIVRQHIKTESGHTFELGKGPLFRALLFRENEEKYIMLFNIHHIISDGWSKGILIKEIFDLYKNYNSGFERKLEPLSIQYKEYAAWQVTYSADQGRYWRELYKNNIPELNFPLDFKRPNSITFKGAMLKALLDETLTGDLQHMATQNKITLNSLLLSLYALWVAGYAGQEEVVIGSLTSGRSHVELENLVGVFINFLPIKLSVSKLLKLSEYFEASHHSIIEAYSHQDYPFDLMVDDCIRKRDLSRNPFFDTMVNFHWEADVKDSVLVAKNFLSDTGLAMRPFQLSEEDFFHSVLDFMLDIEPVDGRLELYLSYNAHLFLRERMNTFLDGFVTLLKIVVQDADNYLPQYFPVINSPTELLTTTPAAETEVTVQNLSVHICSSFVAEPLIEYLEYWSNELEMRTQVSFAPYNQVFQQLLNPESMLNKNNGLNVLFIRIEDWLRDKIRLSIPEQVDFLNSTYLELTKALSHRRWSSTTPFLFGIVPLVPSHSLNAEVAARIEDLNDQLVSVLKDQPGFYLLDLKLIASLYLVEEIFDLKSDELGHIPFTQEYYAALGTYISRKIRAYTGKPYKVIAVDCDNTLWKGVCGEIGAMEVIVDENFAYLQRFLLEKYKEGFLLVLCSKNNEEDVWEVFNRNPEMILKREHIAAYSVNWNPKHENLLAIANELNLATDSFIFLDDSNFEIEQMLTLIPDVLSLALPEDPNSFYDFLNHIWAFDVFRVTGEDARRNNMYKAEKQRKDEQANYSSLNDFLQSLEIQINLRPLEEKDLQRAVQLNQRTNQFNLNGIRRSAGDISKRIHQQNSLNWIIDVSDRFGDYGIVGLLLATKTNSALVLESLMLSCRVLGRNVEDFVLDELQTYCITHSLDTIVAQFQRSAKNQPFIEFLERTGWIKNPEINLYNFLVKYSPQEFI